MTRLIVLAPILFLACTPEDQPPPEVEVDPMDDGCPAMFAQEILPEYHVEISASEWAAMEDEFLNRVQREQQGLDPKPYHPVTFRYVLGDETGEVPNVLMRLKGASSWLQAIDLDEDPKMQFVIAFNEINPDGRWKGVRKVELDMPRTDQTFLRQRIALTYLREVGLPAQCANSAKLYINGEYYGLYTNLERLDKEFLQRQYGEMDEGDLWKNGRIIKTNEETFSWARLDALWDVPDVASFDELADLDAAMQEWAAEAVVGDADGYWNGRANFFLYDHPTRGFVWIPNDLDTVFAVDYLPHDASPIFPTAMYRWERDWHHYLVAMNDPGAVELFVSAIADARDGYDVAKMQRRADQYSAQIATAAEDDQRRPFTMDVHAFETQRMRDFMPARIEYIDAWLECRQSGGADADDDGFDMCHDCNDADGTVRPGAPETCNLRDDNCDGRVDSVDGVSVCE